MYVHVTLLSYLTTTSPYIFPLPYLCNIVAYLIQFLTPKILCFFPGKQPTVLADPLGEAGVEQATAVVEAVELECDMLKLSLAETQALLRSIQLQFTTGAEELKAALQFITETKQKIGSSSAPSLEFRALLETESRIKTALSYLDGSVCLVSPLESAPVTQYEDYKGIVSQHYKQGTPTTNVPNPIASQKITKTEHVAAETPAASKWICQDCFRTCGPSFTL